MDAKWRSGCLKTRFSLATLLYRSYSMKLQEKKYIFTNFKLIKNIDININCSKIKYLKRRRGGLLVSNMKKALSCWLQMKKVRWFGTILFRYFLYRFYAYIDLVEQKLAINLLLRLNIKVRWIFLLRIFDWCSLFYTSEIVKHLASVSNSYFNL